MANNNIEGQILAGDKTILDVFGEKSQVADEYMIPGGKNIFGQEVAPLSQVELLEMIMPFAGSIRGGKQALGNFKFLSKNWDILGKKLKGDVAGLSSRSIGKKNINISKADKEFADAYEEFMKFHAKNPPKLQPRADKSIKPSKFTKEYIEQRNKEAVESLKYEEARKVLNTIMKKHGITDPDNVEFVDTITDLLTRSRN